MPRRSRPDSWPADGLFALNAGRWSSGAVDAGRSRSRRLRLRLYSGKGFPPVPRTIHPRPEQPGHRRSGGSVGKGQALAGTHLDVQGKRNLARTPPVPPAQPQTPTRSPGSATATGRSLSLSHSHQHLSAQPRPETVEDKPRENARENTAPRSRSVPRHDTPAPAILSLLRAIADTPARPASDPPCKRTSYRGSGT
jgi:hypothetical protein